MCRKNKSWRNFRSQGHKYATCLTLKPFLHKTTVAPLKQIQHAHKQGNYLLQRNANHTFFSKNEVQAMLGVNEI